MIVSVGDAILGLCNVECFFHWRLPFVFVFGHRGKEFYLELLAIIGLWYLLVLRWHVSNHPFDALTVNGLFGFLLICLLEKLRYSVVGSCV